MDKDDKSLIGVYVLYGWVVAFGWAISVNRSLSYNWWRIPILLLPLVIYKIILWIMKLNEIDENWNKYHGTDVIGGDDYETKQ